MPAGTVESLLKPENKQKLTEILTYHVVGGKAMAADVAIIDEAKSVNGKMIDIKVEGTTVKVNDAAVKLPTLLPRMGSSMSSIR